MTSITHDRCMMCGHTELSIIDNFDAFAQRAALAGDERKLIHDYFTKNAHATFSHFVRCDACGFVRIDPMPEEKTLTHFYQNYYANQNYARKKDKKIARTRKRLRGLKRYVSSGRFLDVGCNVGFAVEAARLEGLQATGIEIDADAVKYASEHFPENRYTATTIADYQPNAAYDLVHTSEVIEHVPDPVDFAKHLARLTKPGGYLFLTTPDAGHFRCPSRFVDWKEVKPLEHITWQTRASLSKVLQDHGFEKPHFFFNFKPGIRLLAKKRA